MKYSEQANLDTESGLLLAPGAKELEGERDITASVRTELNSVPHI